MTRATLCLLLCLAACGGETKVVTRIELAEPTPPSADLLTPLVPVTTAGSKSTAEAIERLSIAIRVRDDVIKGWRDWHADMLSSIRTANAAKDRR